MAPSIALEKASRSGRLLSFVVKVSFRNVFLFLILYCIILTISQSLWLQELGMLILVCLDILVTGIGYIWWRQKMCPSFYAADAAIEKAIVLNLP